MGDMDDMDVNSWGVSVHPSAGTPLKLAAEHID
jgi:hypothetical protein